MAEDTPQGFAPVPGSGSPHRAEADLPRSEDRNLAVLAHLSALAGLIGIPLGNVLGPLVVWLVTKDRSPFLDDQGKEALNFQITATIIGLVLGVILFVGLLLTFVLVGIPLLVIGGAGLLALFVFVVVVMIMAAVEANKGVWYRYPIRMTFVK